MISGLRVQMTSGELSARLAERIAWHAQTASEYRRELRLPEDERNEPLMPEHVIEHELHEHQEQVAVLTLLRDHLIPGETYVLGEQDLRFADLAGSFEMIYALPRRLAADVAAR